LVFGDDAKEGLVRGQVFIHPDLRFRFEVPEGFTLKNMPTLVLATHKNGTKIKFAMAATKDVREAGGMEKFFVRKWGSGLSMEKIEWLDINGMPAITAEASIWSGRSNTIVRRILVERDKNTYWRFQFEIPPQKQSEMNEPLRQTTYSLRTPSRSEIAKAKSWRIRVVKVNPGVTYEDMVNSMAVDEMKAEWFEAINNLKPEDPLPRGGRIKVVR